MIQRIQTLYLLLAFAAMIVCLSLPIGRFVAEGEVMAKMYNLVVVSQEGTRSFTPWALFVLLIIAALNGPLAILLYRKRMRQIRLCIFNMLLMIGYVAAYGLFAFMLKAQMVAQTATESVDFIPEWSASLPLVALLLTYLAWRAILKDEMLVRSLDRLR